MKKRKDVAIYYIVPLLIAVVFGLMLELNLFFLLVVIVMYTVSVPRIIDNQRKYAYERERFGDINSYMSQMAQSFIYTKNIIKSLEETAACFAHGPMSEALVAASCLLEEGKADIKQAEKAALSYIESKYDCEKLRNLHSFFLNTEEIGGECAKEFKILESMRIAWQSVVEEIRIKKLWERNIGAVIYGFFLVVCVIMLHIMRDSNLEIITLWPTQIINLFMMVGYMGYFLFMDKRLSQSLLISPRVISEKKAEEYFKYLEFYDSKIERRKYISFSVLSLVISAILLYKKPTWITLAFCICFVLVGCNLHTIIHINTIQIVKSEIGKAFPKWLFDVMLLLQRESVEGAIEQSYETAPPILKRDLYRIIVMLEEKPHDPEAYMSFLRDFNIQSVNEIMHKLYSLAVGANRDSEVLDVVMERNIKSLEKAERDGLMFRDSVKSFTWVPFLCVGFGCMGYLVIAIMTSVNGIIDLIR